MVDRMEFVVKRRKFLAAVTVTAFAGCSESGSGPSGDDSETTPEADDDSSEKDQQPSDDGQSGQQETGGEPEPEDEYDQAARIKNVAQEEWIQLPLEGLDIPAYEESNPLERVDDIGIYGEVSRTDTEAIRDDISHNVIEDNFEKTHSIILIYQDEDAIPAGIDQERAEQFISDKDLLTGWPVIPEYSLSEDSNYPGSGESAWFDEESVEKFFDEYVSQVRDVSEGFPDELLEYAQQ